jgi:phosphohistidine phosphatase
MKTLIIMRHGKSSKDDPTLADAERPLNKRGKSDAPEMGKRMRKKNINPDLLVSSPAKRAISTARLVSEELGYKEDKIEMEPRIYEASVSDLMEVIHSLPEESEISMLFGHNPGFTDLIGYLCGDYIDNLPTSGIAIFEFNIPSWKHVGKENGKMVLLDYPKNGN